MPFTLRSIQYMETSVLRDREYMLIKTIPELSKPAFGVLPKTGDAEPEDPGKPG